jgi:hypothetical protein
VTVGDEPAAEVAQHEHLRGAGQAAPLQQLENRPQRVGRHALAPELEAVVQHPLLERRARVEQRDERRSDASPQQPCGGGRAVSERDVELVLERAGRPGGVP